MFCFLLFYICFNTISIKNPLIRKYGYVLLPHFLFPNAQVRNRILFRIDSFAPDSEHMDGPETYVAVLFLSWKTSLSPLYLLAKLK